MKLFFYLLFAFGFTSNILAQEMAIPYRDGNKWGFCNEDAKITIPVQFDSYENKKAYNSSLEYVLTKKDNLVGLVIDGKEILKPIYTEIYEDDNLFTITSDENGGSQDRITSDGKSIFDKKYARISSSGRIGGSFYLYIVLNFDGTEDVLAFNAKTQQIFQKLYENIYAVTRLPKQFDEKQYTFLIQKKKNSKLVEESWNLTKLPFVKNKLGLRYVSEAEFLHYFSDKYYQNKWNSSKNNYGEISQGQAYEYNDEVVPPRSVNVGEGNYNSAPNEIPNKNEKISKTYQFIKNKEGVVLQVITNNQSNNIELIPIKLDLPLQDIQFQHVMLRNENGNNLDTFYNYIHYKKGEKTGLIFAKDFNNPVEFDFTDRIYTHITDVLYKGSELIFKVGKKDENSQMKYGFYSNINKQIVDFIYDELELTTFYAKNRNRVYIAKKDDKFGFIQADGTILLQINKDKIEKVKNESSSNFSYQFLENNKYGVVYPQNLEIIKTEAIFDFPIKEIHSNFQSKFIRKNGITNQKSITLLELMDENGNSLGFANSNGTLYFKN